VWLQIAPADGYYKITWGQGLPHPVSYDVEAEPIKSAAAEVREKLQALAEWNGHGGALERRNLLVELAKAGAAFRSLLFDNFQQAGRIRRLQDWLEKEYQAGDHSLVIRAPSTIQMPWGLVYGGSPPLRLSENDVARDPKLLDFSVERALFAPFWSLTYRLHVTQGAFMRSECDMRRPKAGFGILSLLNSTVERQIHKVEKGCEESEGDLFTGASRKQEECQSTIDGTKFKDVIFYFLGHHSDATLDLGNETISGEEFGRLMERLAGRLKASAESSCGLIFLNGCQTAYGANRKLRNYTECDELCGVIATESRVPIPFAHKLGVKLLSMIKNEGASLSVAMRRISNEEEFWPLCLTYGCYADPRYQIEQGETGIDSTRSTGYV
jgi:hypothetical protein